MRVAALNLLLRCPFCREFLLAYGLISASKSSLRYSLRQGHAVGLVVGVDQCPQ